MSFFLSVFNPLLLYACHPFFISLHLSQIHQPIYLPKRPGVYYNQIHPTTLCIPLAQSLFVEYYHDCILSRLQACLRLGCIIFSHNMLRALCDKIISHPPKPCTGPTSPWSDPWQNDSPSTGAWPVTSFRPSWTRLPPDG